MGTNLFYRVIGDAITPTKTKTFSMRETVAWGNGLFPDAKLWVDPTPIMLDGKENVAEWELAPFTASIHGQQIQTDIPMKAERGLQPLTDADISANVFSETENDSFFRNLLDAVRIGDLTLNQLPILPTQINLFLGENQHVSTTHLIFGTPLTQRHAALVLSGFGITEQLTTQLPDGSIMFTHRPLNATGTALFTNRKTERFGTIRLQERELRFGDDVEKPTGSVNKSCHLDSEWLAFSSKGTLAMLESMGAGSINSSLPALRVGSNKNMLTLCLSTDPK